MFEVEIIMGKKIYSIADLTIGDVGVPITATTNVNISGYALGDLEFIFIKPSGATMIRNPTSISGKYTAIYTTAEGDIDEDGEWSVYLRNALVGYEFVKGNSAFFVRPKALDMAMYNG